VATEELFDIQQQADFFISLGEDEQAIQLLRDHIAESQVPSALTYLDLLKIYHRQGRQEQYEQLRTEFNRLFNAGAPAFEQFSDEGRGLEFYERALGRIQALWPEPRVLDVIEQSIFREAGDPESEVFDLEAYRELLLLYALAKEMIQREAVDSKLPKDFENTKVQALKATARRAAAALTNSPISGNPLPMEQRPRVSRNLGLDVNLDDLPAPSAFEVSLPDMDLSVGPADDAVRLDESRVKNSHMIDFEALGFSPPDEGKLFAELVDKKP
jgi:DNA-binding transcriptional regulator YbjK